MVVELVKSHSAGRPQIGLSMTGATYSREISSIRAANSATQRVVSCVERAPVASLHRNGDGGIKSRVKNAHVSVSDGVVMLYGATRDCGAAHDIERAIRAHTGSEAIQNNIQTIGPYLNA